ncbi:MAG: class I SAM-dependent methyltransferase [Verrucomicrobia bacterium]|nr:class I SAM-dependent methyltransferase [Verrucomicrobiota bacterium]
MDRIEFETTICSVCGSAACARWLSDLRDRAFSRPETFTLVRCENCGHIYQNPRPTEASLRFCYPPDYGPHHAMRDGVAARLRRWVLQREAVACAARTPPQSHLLEVGCATGDFLEIARARGFTVAGVESDEQAAGRARSSGLEIFTGVLKEAGFHASSFDIVYMKHVIEHLPDVRGTLSEIHRILKPGGWLFVATCNICAPLTRCFGKDTFDLEMPRHLNIYSAASLKRQLDGSGFRVVTVCHDPVPNSWIHSCRLHLEGHSWARAFFRLENPLALFMFSPLSVTLAALGLSSRIQVWCRRHE